MAFKKFCDLRVGHYRALVGPLWPLVNPFGHYDNFFNLGMYGVHRGVYRGGKRDYEI